MESNFKVNRVETYKDEDFGVWNCFFSDWLKNYAEITSIEECSKEDIEDNFNDFEIWAEKNEVTPINDLE